jgi:CRP-like cAMP-binding protein
MLFVVRFLPPTVGQAALLTRAFHRLSRTNQTRSVMRKVLYIFGLLSDADVQWIAKTGVLKRLRNGDVVIHEGEQTDALIFILEGELAVSNLVLGQFARMGVGEIVGEISLVDSAPPSATVTARGDGLALFLDKEMLIEKLAADNGFGSRFYRALAVFLADRLREARRSSGNRSMGETDIADDELDVGILDRVSSAGDRFNQMLKTLSSQRPSA